MTEHVHKWLPTRNKCENPTEFFGWCECEETISLAELCKRANATERLSAEDATKAWSNYQSVWDEHITPALRAYADELEDTDET